MPTLPFLLIIKCVPVDEPTTNPGSPAVVFTDKVPNGVEEAIPTVLLEVTLKMRVPVVVDTLNISAVCDVAPLSESVGTVVVEPAFWIKIGILKSRRSKLEFQVRRAFGVTLPLSKAIMESSPAAVALSKFRVNVSAFTFPPEIVPMRVVALTSLA